MDYTWQILFGESEQFDGINLLHIKEMYINHGNYKEYLPVFGEMEFIHSSYSHDT